MVGRVLVHNRVVRHGGQVKQFSKTIRDKRLHPQPLQSRNGNITSGAQSTCSPIVSFANTVRTVYYNDTVDETTYVVFCDQPEDVAGGMPSGPPSVVSCFAMPHAQVQRLKAALNYHSAHKDPAQPSGMYNFT